MKESKNPKIELAKTLAKTVHIGQKYGELDYFEHHVCGVVNSLINSGFTDENIIITAYLHDSVEDTEITIPTIRNLFGDSIAKSVEYLTKTSCQSRQQYLEFLREDRVARIVKLHDAFFNLNSCLLNKNKNKANYYINTISHLESGG